MKHSDDGFEKPVSKPHDAAFKKAFQKKKVARAFFRHYLPTKIVKYIDLNCLEIQNRSYVDKKMKDKHSDMVYRTRIFGKLCYLYLLLEHQSTPDRRMPFRLLC